MIVNSPRSDSHKWDGFLSNKGNQLRKDLIEWLKDFWFGSLDAQLEVRVQYLEVGTGSFWFYFGDSRYDGDVRGFWGYGILKANSDLDQLADEMITDLVEDIDSYTFV